ncbi:unnamed protein product (macronuclear) [Paramecium tetraurelia]|uniref:Uncharacterized protein n=1 Tax=Paramecium tetraurelia TaxID=5888 RepID=A0DE19_PARTE|nr:uncharacterized protein GSPATT00016128001 [Paramecium tetraurelia]CAK81286.1 unnamed protein product [Paramecium tetraurelia]|eukprot:XP_001448683.1 hypothetical protein (macronuclear) [Paramecium tetraurelia strain d4-2]
MIGKEQVDVIDQYASSIVNYVDNQQKIIQLKTSTIQKLNEVTIVHYQKNLDKINQIRSEFEETKSIQNKLDENIQKINQIQNSIEGMESSVDHLDSILKRIESKLTELEKLKQ